MRNCDIVRAVYARDRSKELIKQSNLYNDKVNRGSKDFSEFSKYADIFGVLKRLDDWRYQVTERDAKILRKYNVLVSPHNSSNYTALEDDSFVAVSDFHACRYPLDKVKNHYMNEYGKVFILGDATDRGNDGMGSNGIELLIEIMKLCKANPDKVVYIPGNHDEFLIGYIAKKHNLGNNFPLDYLACLYRNGGENTLRDLKTLEKDNPDLFLELFNWLGSQPLQRKHVSNGQEYVFGHAMFNQSLYDINPNYCLFDYFNGSKYSESSRMAKDVLWFRKDKDRYNPREMPTSNKKMIIGHTREIQTRGKNLNVVGSDGREVKVHCVDGGVAYEGGMLKYDGGSDVMWTVPAYHRNTSKSRGSIGTILDPEIIYQDHILGQVLRNGKLGIHNSVFGKGPDEISSYEVDYIAKNKFANYVWGDPEYMRSLYVKTFLFDYILECQIERMKDRRNNDQYVMREATSLMDMYLFGSDSREFSSAYGYNNYVHSSGNNGMGDEKNITSNRNARFIAQCMGPVAMKDVLRVYGCKSVDEYVSRKYGMGSKNNNQSYGRSGTTYS